MARWHNCPSLAVFWCNGIFIIFYLYTIYVASTRYNQFKINSGNPRFGFNWKENYIAFYLSCILIASLLWLLFLYSSLFQTGNLANDYVELGRISSVTDDQIYSVKCLPICERVFKRICYHFIPFNSFIHLFGAFFLLVPIPLLIEEENKHGITHLDNEQAKSLFLCIYIPEIANFLLAAFCLTVRLPTVFSSTSKSFGVIFSMIIFIATSNLFIHCVTNQVIVSYMSQMNWRIAISNIAIFCISISNFCLIYEHGRTRFLDSIISRKIDSQEQTSLKSGISSFNKSLTEKYWPNILSFLLWIGFIALNLDQYSSNVIYNLFYLLDICISLTHCFVWLVVWLLFTFKSDWEFSGPKSYLKSLSENREQTFQTTKCFVKPCDTIYTCFQVPEQIRSLSSHSSKTPNHEISSASSSSSSRISERVVNQNHIPSISKQLEFSDCNYDELGIFKSTLRPSKVTLKEISEENPDYQEMYKIRSELSPSDKEFFKSPNISQHSSNIHSSDSGIGINYRDNPDFLFNNKIPENDVLKYRAFTPQSGYHTKPHEYNIDEELLDHCELNNINMCSDV